MESITKTKNVARGEAIFRYVVGVLLVISAISTSGLLRWILGLIGVVIILTAIYGY
jgi:hypothetical protein